MSWVVSAFRFLATVEVAAEDVLKCVWSQVTVLRAPARHEHEVATAEAPLGAVAEERWALRTLEQQRVWVGRVSGTQVL